MLELGPNYSIVLEAIDPTTGNEVAGVEVYDVTIYVRNLEGGEDDSRLTQWLQEQEP